MATLTIRNVNPTIKERLRVRAAQNGRSMEAECAPSSPTRSRRRLDLPNSISMTVYGLASNRSAASNSNFRPGGRCASRRPSNDLPPRHQCPVGDHEAEAGGRNRIVDASTAAAIAVHCRHLPSRDPCRIAVLPPGRRRAELEAMAQAIFSQDFEGRVLPFDAQAATAYAELFAIRRLRGRPIETPDLIVAATAQVHDAAIVTRDVGGFEGCGLTLINPWDA